MLKSAIQSMLLSKRPRLSLEIMRDQSWVQHLDLVTTPSVGSEEAYRNQVVLTLLFLLEVI